MTGRQKDKCPPYFPFFPRDFLSSTSVDAMTTEEVGAYVFLLSRAWLETPAASVPDDDKILARMARLSPGRWAKAKAQVLAPWELVDGRWTNKRLREEYENALEIMAKKAIAGKAGATGRWGKPDMADAWQTHGTGNADAMRNDAMQSKAEHPIADIASLQASVSSQAGAEVSSVWDALPCLLAVGMERKAATKLASDPRACKVRMEWAVPKVVAAMRSAKGCPNPAGYLRRLLTSTDGPAPPEPSGPIPFAAPPIDRNQTSNTIRTSLGVKK